MKHENAHKQYIAYYRVSKLSESGKEYKEKGESSLGIQAQQSIVHHYYDYAIVKEFTEVKSAKNIEGRPLLQEAIAECIKGGYTLVVARLDRLSRRTEDTLRIFEQLHGRLEACNIPGKLEKFVITLFAALAEREREMIRINVKNALKVRIEKSGNWQNHSHPNNKKFMDGTISKAASAAWSEQCKNNPNRRRAESVIRDKRKEGMNDSEIAIYLNNNSFTTPRGGEFRSGQVGRY